MLKTESGDIVISASDLTAFSNCEWSLVRKIDQLVGHDVTILKDEDEMTARAAAMGDVHEQRHLDKFRAQFPGSVVEFARPDSDVVKTGSDAWRAVMADLHEQTIQALRDKAPVIFQGTFFDGRFQGFSDFLVLDAEGNFEVYDTKLARKAKITALLQLAAYAEQLQLSGIPTSTTVRLILGDDTPSIHKLADIMPAFVKRRDALRALIVARQANFAAGGPATQWGDPALSICGSCVNCKEQIELAKDLLLVAGLTRNQRKHLMAAGVSTWEGLAQTTVNSIPGVGKQTFDRLRRQAAEQLKTSTSSDKTTPKWTLANSGALSALPAASDGDIFFDFEGDPLFQEEQLWNLDYLFGWVDRQSKFDALWAHDIDKGEKKAFADFVAELERRLVEYPDMHIYHYASYEKTHIIELSKRHGIGEQLVDKLLRENRLVDLYPVVKNAFIIGGANYSLKTVEKIFRPDKREGKVVDAVGSVIEYAHYCELRDEGKSKEAEAKLQEIADYNEDDCISTLLLDKWLRERAAENGITYSAPREPKTEPKPWPEVHFELKKALPDIPHSQFSEADRVKALAAAACIFHRREDAVSGAEYYRRLQTPLEDWSSSRDIFTIDYCEVIEDWTGTGVDGRRTLRVTGEWAPGSKLPKVGESVSLYYALGQPLGSGIELPSEGYASAAEVLSADDDFIEVAEKLMTNPTIEVDPHQGVPQALGVNTFIATAPIEQAITEWAQQVVLGSNESDVSDPALDILLRRGLRISKKPEVVDHEFDRAIIDALLQIESSYLAVQGPPGAGKSHNGAAAVAHLVNSRGWKIGIVGQSHSTVETLMHAVNDAGVDPAWMAKKPQSGRTIAQEKERSDLAWTPMDGLKTFLAVDHGLVLGGTVWDFVNRKKIDRDTFKLDLLVIDEAGQFSLANTIAASVAAKRLLLLGDPQQLPQVTQASHEDPIDTSALGWLSEGHDVLPSEFGYFLDQSWRMHESLCTVVADLAYEGKLTSKGDPRHLVGHDPGFFPVPIQHADNSTESAEEADAVVEKVRELVSLQWVEEGNTGMLGAVEKNIIVVAPFNAQVQLIEAKLKAAGFGAIPVGTVDKFQGKEAAIAIVSITASSATDVPRGIEFILMQNRINVAISRAKWAAFMFYSPELTEFLPANVEQLKLLSRFIALIDET